MTGFGEAQRKDAVFAVSVEVRTINSRYFKLAIRCGEGYATLEPLIETLVRQHIKRGTVQVTLRIDRARASDDYQLNAAVLTGYREQLQKIYGGWKVGDQVGVEALLGCRAWCVRTARDRSMWSATGRWCARRWTTR